MFTHSLRDDWENIHTLSYYHHQIGSMNYYPLFGVRSWNNGMRCMSFYILIGPIWGRQDPGGPHVGLANLAIWEYATSPITIVWCYCKTCNSDHSSVSTKTIDINGWQHTKCYWHRYTLGRRITKISYCYLAAHSKINIFHQFVLCRFLVCVIRYQNY